MDGAKPVTDTIEFRKKYGRQAFYLDRSTSTRMYGPGRNEDPGGSRI